MGTTTTTVKGITFTITQGTAGDLLYSTENFPGASGPGTTGYCGGMFTADALYTSISERKSLIESYDKAALQAESDLIKVLSFPKQELGPDYTQAQYNFYVKELQDKRDAYKQKAIDAQFLSDVQQTLISQVSGVTAAYKASNPDSNTTPSSTGAEPSPVANEDNGTPSVSNSQPALTSDPAANPTITTESNPITQQTVDTEFAGTDQAVQIQNQQNAENYVNEFGGVDQSVQNQQAQNAESYYNEFGGLEEPADLSTQIEAASDPVAYEIDNQPQEEPNPDLEEGNARGLEGGVTNARVQASSQDQGNAYSKDDWRVRIQLAPGANYLYAGDDPGILTPLIDTQGVLFPYTPQIQVTYAATYDTSELTHSNYKLYQYKSSSVDNISITCDFTAQDTNEANYVLAVIHFFRSVTKMFYGQDPEAGTPPPLVYLSAYGQYQYAEHPCVVSNFSYNLPADVDYIRARSVSINGTNLITRRDRQNNAPSTSPLYSAISRLKTVFMPKGALPQDQGSQPYDTTGSPVELGGNNPTYVPTQMEIQVTLLPVQSRSQVSKQFSLNKFAQGELLRGGFW